ncbi:hypothetical protein GMJLKIPL_5717 [Methylobacterium isbiliense]|uniref:TonB-dependent receptor plug domain-containing protein n=1 Tax=Methylobacterium isbiliense TaxID=315478 RepID=A0ABQ4SML6_9HYPH|nr:hypothetical protein GMJLKIPL_5717 [Methylobacterium isbiliense]
MPGLIPGCDHVGAQGRVGRDVLGDPAHEADVPVDAGDREEGVADAAHRAVRGAQDPIPENQRLAATDPLQRSRRTLAVLRMEAGEPTCDVRHVLGGHAPDLREGGAEIVELPALQVDEPEHVGRMCGEAPEALLALAQGRLGPLALSDLKHSTGEFYGTAILERGSSVGGDPALDRVFNPDHAILDVVDAIPGRVGASGNGFLDLRPIVEMNGGQPHAVIDMGVRRQAPHGLEPRIPFQCARSRIPSVR